MWTCSECRSSFDPTIKKYHFNLCHTCYFNPTIAKLYRSGKKQPLIDEPALIGPGCDPDIIDPNSLLEDTFQFKIQETGRWSSANPPVANLPLRARAELCKLSDLSGDSMIESGRAINLLTIAVQSWNSPAEFAKFVADTEGSYVIRRLVNDLKLIYHINGSLVYVSIGPGVMRFLHCARCEVGWPISRIWEDKAFDAHWSNFEFVGTCRECKHYGTLLRHDHPAWDKFKVTTFKNEEIVTTVDNFTLECQLVWELPEALRMNIYGGEKEEIYNLPWEIIRAAQSGKLCFDRGRVHRVKDVVAALQGSYSAHISPMSDAQLNSLLNANFE